MTNNPFEALKIMYDEHVEEANKKGNTVLFKEAANYFFKTLNDKDVTKFTFIDIEYLDGYFIFGMGTNSVVHFHIKECPGWKFGIWWDEPKSATEVSGKWFAQFEETIDKFKPSASIFYQEFNIKGSGIEDIRKDIEFIKNNPYLAFCRDYYGYDYLSGEEAKQQYDEWREKTDREKVLTIEWDSKILEWVKINILPLFTDAIIIEEEDCRPKYEVVAPLDKNLDIVGKPGYYSWYADEMTEEDIELSKEFNILIEEAKKIFEEIDSYYFSPIQPCILFRKRKEE